MIADDLIVIATYSFPFEAQIAKSSLQAAGIQSYISDEYTINMDWFYSDALGGVKLLVLQEDAELARNILEADFSEAVEEQASGDLICPHCQSHDVTQVSQHAPPFKDRDDTRQRSAFLAILLLGFPLTFSKRQPQTAADLYCNDCKKYSNEAQPQEALNQHNLQTPVSKNSAHVENLADENTFQA